MPDPLPTPEQRQLLSLLIERAFVVLRELCLTGHAKQAADLAEAFHNMPREMLDERLFSWDRFRELLATYQEKYPSNRAFTDFVSALDEIKRGE